MLDEPTSGVGPLGRARLWDTIRGAAEAGTGVLVTTHRMEEAVQCDRLVVMSSARVVAEGTMREILGESRTVEVRTDRWQDAFDALDRARVPVALVGARLRVPETDPERVREILDAEGVPAWLDTAPATFDEVFVRLSSEG